MSGLREAMAAVLGALDRLEIRYFVGGSVASGIYGAPRLTNGLDLVIDVRGLDADALSGLLEEEFAVDRESVREAVETGRPFNAIHRRGVFKFDFFPGGRDAFSDSELGRRQFVRCGLAGMEEMEFAVASAEDSLLAKLRRFRLGGEVSERQWHDVEGIVRTQGEEMDWGYIAKWAGDLGVEDLLDRLRRT